MNIIILAAGMGNRLGELTRELPKALVPVNGTPLLSYVFQFLDHPAVQDITVVGGYQFEKVKAFLKGKPVQLLENPHYAKGSILSIATALPTLNTHTLVMNVDHIYPKRMMNKMLNQFKGISAVCDTDRSLVEDDMKVMRRDNGTVEDIDKRLAHWNAGYIGMTFIAKSHIPIYKKAHQDALTKFGDTVALESVLRYLATTNAEVNTTDVSGIHWLEVDNDTDRQLAETILKTEQGFLS